MAKRVCAEVGCPALTDTTRCPTHTRQRDRERGTRQQRGYDQAHDQLRAAAVATLAAGHTLTCWRCGRAITTADDMHIGHDDLDRTITRGPEHKKCNLSAAGKARHGISPNG